jgi:DNA-binding MarR family transcriptional regulator
MRPAVEVEQGSGACSGVRGDVQRRAAAERGLPHADVFRHRHRVHQLLEAFPRLADGLLRPDTGTAQLCVEAGTLDCGHLLSFPSRVDATTVYAMADNATEGRVAFDTLFTDLVRVETRLYNAVAERLKAETDVGAGHFELLRYLRDHPDARVADVAATFAIGVGTTSKIVDRLEKQGWLERRPNPANRRSSLLALTPEGESVVSRAEPVWQAAIHEILGATVTAKELTALSRTFGALRSDLERRNLGLPTG